MSRARQRTTATALRSQFHTHSPAPTAMHHIAELRIISHMLIMPNTRAAKTRRPIQNVCFHFLCAYLYILQHYECV